jgi:hypothetical protein
MPISGQGVHKMGTDEAATTRDKILHADGARLPNSRTGSAIGK